MVQLDKQILHRFSKDMYLERVFPYIQQEKARSFFTLAVTLLAISFFGIFAISPTLVTITNLQKQLSDDQIVDQQLQTKISNLSTLEQKYAQMQDDLPNIYAALPQTPQPVLLFAELQSIAKDNTVRITNMQTATPVAPLKNIPQKANSYDVDLDTEGTPSDSFNFLHALATLDRIVTIDNMTFSTTSQTLAKDGSEVHINVKLQAHYKTTDL